MPHSWTQLDPKSLKKRVLDPESTQRKNRPNVDETGKVPKC